MSLPSLQHYHKRPYGAISPFRPELSQDGRTVIVTGGSSGIGLAIARGYLAAGASHVILLGRRQEVLEAAVAKLRHEAQTYEQSGQVEGIVCDVYNLALIERLWRSLEARVVFVRVLVLSAAAYGATETILQGGIQKVWSDFEANVRSPLAMTDYFYKQKSGGYLVNVSTCAAYMWTTMGPERPTYGLTKNSGTALLQQIAKDVNPSDMQIVSFHPGGILTDSARKLGAHENMGLVFDDENLPGQFAIWAASSEAKFLHGRFVWANWDVSELSSGDLRRQIDEDEHFLKVGIEGLTEKTGGMILT
ncbi:NAD(P)-binding protein [Paraphaeosphaeria sporulosa]|uniref:NAD(P)-binding protein n=1 Tax=Paraphaeosphaeria sporulosa TaxID=1460663 RepID=A0A177CMC1_9PLEO|nr:NAD(P)-binding protein [Paraphaeosphaeria sporulosa]OAG08446.1 NAD(P)-binding protein [Paraphaeosphaeria sporulosa]